MRPDFRCPGFRRHGGQLVPGALLGLAAFVPGCSSPPVAPIARQGALVPVFRRQANVPLVEHTWCRRAEKHFRSGDTDAVLHDTQQDLKDAPDCPHAHLLAGLVLERLAAYKSALEHFARAAQGAPGDPKILNAYGRALARNGDYRRAIEVLEGMARVDAPQAEPFRWLGYAYMHLSPDPENVRRAQMNLRRAVTLQPGYPEASCDLGLLLFNEGKTQEALSLVEASVDRQRHYPPGLLLLARIYRTMGDTARADHLQSAFEKEDALARRQEALALRLQRNPGDLDAMLAMAQTMQQLDKPEEALRCLKRAASVAPNDPRVKKTQRGIQSIPAPGATVSAISTASTVP